MSSWPVVLRLKTRKIIDGIDPFPVTGILQMKSIDNFSAYLKQADLQRGKIVLYDTETQLATLFQSAGELFNAGWIADLQSDLQNNEGKAELYELPGTAVNLPAQTGSSGASRIVPFKACSSQEQA